MLMKLFKWDFNKKIKTLLIFFLLSIFFCITTRILFSLKQSPIVYIMGQISVGCMFSMLANVLISTLMRNWISFRDTVFGDESYLTHTLPVTKKEIYASKFWNAVVNLLFAFILVIVCVFIAYFNKERWDIVMTFINNISNQFNVNKYTLIILFPVILFLEILTVFQSGFLGIILGHRHNTKQKGLSVFYAFVIYCLTQLFILLILFILGIFNNDIMNLFVTESFDPSLIKWMIYLSIGFYLFLNIIIKYIAEKVLSLGVNVL